MGDLPTQINFCNACNQAALIALEEEPIKLLVKPMPVLKLSV